MVLLPDHEQRIFLALRNLILENCPELEEHIAYNAPFYRRKSNVCFLWPATVPWGNVKAGVSLGFTKGYLLSDYDNILEKGTRKQIHSIVIEDLHDVKTEVLLSYLFEAIELDK